MLSGKSRWLIFVIIAITLSMTSTDVFGERIVKYFTASDGTAFYYNQDRMKRSSGKVKVWTTQIWGDELRRSIQQRFTNENYKDLSYSVGLMEIDCKEETYQILSVTHYNAKGEVIYAESGRTEVEYFPPGSSYDYLKNHVCK